MGNNRTTLESKDFHRHMTGYFAVGNNRTTLESKAVILELSSALTDVIIEPHWNLKVSEQERAEFRYLCNNRTTLEFRVFKW